MKKNYFFALAGSLLSLSALAQAPAQRACASMDVLQQQIAADPAMAQRMQAIERQTEQFATSSAAQKGTQAVITIPVVFHVVYRTAAENVSDAMLQSQINVMNQDFAKMNSDITKVPSVFAPLATNTNIQFCLAQKDPSGNATTGIIRKSTTVTSFSSNDAVKYSANGGSNAWPAGQYLNFWVCNLGGGLLGYAQFPGGAAATDGVVCLYSSLPGGTSAPFNKGRTATHEVGHWLNLRHIWGDANCGSDLVSDTPTQQTSNGGCPAFPKVTCSNGPNGDMHMNYMDYTDDACMYMFTAGQSTRMNAVLAPGGARASLATSAGCVTGTPGTCGVPTGLSATAITSSGATLNWGAASGATSYNVQWKAATASTWSSGTTTGTAGSISGLAASTAYQYQVASVCASGTSAFSAIGTFTTTAAGTGTGSTATVGTGTTLGTTTSNNTPYGTYYMDQRAQFIITKAELTAGGYTSGSYLKSLAFNTGTAATQVLNGFTIKISHTTAASFGTSSFLVGSGTTQVFSGNVTAGSNIWNTHNFSTAFAYNGTSNLLVEVCFNNSSYTTNTPVRYTATAANMSNYYRADVAAAGVCANASGTLSTARPNMRLTFSSTAREGQVIEIGDAQPSVSVYPNPASSDINVAYTLTADRDDVQVEIYNQLGALVKTIAVGSKAAGEHNLNIDLNSANLANGMYVCTLRDGNSLQSVRFVLSK
jgi:hypothetical protein